MTQQVIDFLNRKQNFEEAAEVTAYQVYVHSRPLTVEVYDHGEGTGNLRYAVAAYWTGLTEEDRDTSNAGYTMGNPEATLAMALHGPHWHKFGPED